MASPRRTRGWIWFFVVLAVLTATSITILITFNLRQQLTPAQLDQARALWQTRGPRDYHLNYSKEGSVEGHLQIEVHDGRVVQVTDNGRPLEARQYAYYSMPALFDELQRFLEMKDEPGGYRRFLTAQFDPQDGHVQTFIFSDPNSRQREKVTIELTPGQGNAGGTAAHETAGGR